MTADATGPDRAAGLTVRGRSVLAAGIATAACAVVLDERDLLRLGVVLAALPVLAVALAARTRRTVRVERALTAGRVPVGSETQVGLTLTGGPLLGPLQVTDTVPDAAGPAAAAPPHFTVHRLGARLTYPLRPVLRGVHRVGPLRGRAADPLGLAAFDRELAGAARLVVLPRVVGLRGLPPALGTGDGTPGAAPARQGQGTSDVLVRAWRDGDELRRVHWRSTARHDELMVRQEERPWRGGITLVLDRRAGAHRGRGPHASLEAAVALVASICAHLHARGEPVTLTTEDGRDLTGGPAVAGGSGGRGGIEPLLDALAALRPAARTGLTAPPVTVRGDVLAVLGAVTPAELQPLLARPGNGHAVLLDVATWAGPSPGGATRSDVRAAAAALRRAGWRVAVATAGDPPDRVWDVLVAGSGTGAIRTAET